MCSGVDNGQNGQLTGTDHCTSDNLHGLRQVVRLGRKMLQKMGMVLQGDCIILKLCTRI